MTRDDALPGRAEEHVAPCPWPAVFGNDGPVEVEIGPGRGEVLLALAAASPGTNFFAIERAAAAADAIAARAAERGLANVRLIAADARCVLARLVPDASVAAYHVWFPDPWPKTRHRDRRVATDAFARDVARTLVPAGVIHVASDLPGVVARFAAVLEHAGLAAVPGAPLPPHRPTTRFERKYARAGVHYARFVRTPCGPP